MSSMTCHAANESKLTASHKLENGFIIHVFISLNIFIKSFFLSIYLIFDYKGGGIRFACALEQL